MNSFYTKDWRGEATTANPPTVKITPNKHYHTTECRVYLDYNNDLIVAEICIECGEIVTKRRVKTEPMEEEEE